MFVGTLPGARVVFSQTATAAAARINRKAVYSVDIIIKAAEEKCYSHGIHQELLADQPPYNFEDEDERLACERLREG